jgi:DNA-binding NtrC family response regulator
MGYLVWVEGEKAGQTIPLRSHRTTFGRAPDSVVVLTDKKSSRFHAQLLLTGGLVTLVDMGSSNGTEVNGLPVRKTFLNSGDRIDMGENAFVYYDGQPEVEADQRAPAVAALDLAKINQSDRQDELRTELRASEDRATLFSALEAIYIQLRTLFTLSRELPRAAGPSAAFALLAESLHLAIGATRMLLWLRERDTLPPLPTFVETAGDEVEAPPVEKFPRAILEWVEQQRRPLMLAPGVGPLNAETLPNYPVMALPVEAGSTRLGVAVIERIGQTDSFLKRDLDFAVAACGYMALVLSQALEQAASTPGGPAMDGGRFGNIIIGQSQAMRDLMAETVRVAEANSSVLIRGESGTGKELIAHTVHQLSRRSRGPFVAVNCGAIAPTLIESELFGYEKGAFTGALARKAGQFEAADGGTIFLDEVSELPSDAQVKFLRVLQEGEFYRVGGNRTVRVDVRVIAATNRDLEKMIAENRFREDLYFRLNVVELKIAALRDRREDIAPLAEYFFRELRRQIPTALERISAQVMNALTQYAWPGNVRQLRNAIEHALVMGMGKVLSLSHLPEYVTAPATVERKAGMTPVSPRPADEATLTLAEVERKQIEAVLRACEGNKQRAAAQLGISRSTLYEKMRSYGLE